MTQPMARGFRIVYPDGYVIDGAQFPSGRCVLDDPTSGLIEAAVSFDELPLVKRTLGGAQIGRVEWGDE